MWVSLLKEVHRVYGKQTYGLVVIVVIYFTMFQPMLKQRAAEVETLATAISKIADANAANASMASNQQKTAELLDRIVQKMFPTR